MELGSKIHPGKSESWPQGRDLEVLMQERTMEVLDTVTTEKGSGVHGVAQTLGVDPDHGLSGDPDDLEARKSHFGVNYFEPEPPTWYITLWLDAMKDLAIIVLSVMAVLTFCLWVVLERECVPNGFLEPLALVVSVLIITNTTAAIDYAKERMFRKLTDALDSTNTKFVIRNGQQMELTDKDIVVGDIVAFNSHMAATVPADGLLVAGSNVKFDESALNGEPDPAEKTVDAKPFIMSGTICKSGNGKLLVTAVGSRSVSGKIMEAVYGEQEGEDESGGSPLFAKLDAMSQRIGKFGFFVAALCFFSMVLLGTFIAGKDPMEILTYFLMAVTILAVACPRVCPWR